MLQLIFFAASALVLLAGHALFWFIWIKLFGVSATSGRILVAVVVSFLFLSTILASYLIHRADNFFTRWYYIIIAFWVGMLLNLGLTLVAIGLMQLAAIIFNFTWPSFVIKLVFLGGALILSLYGAHNATNPRVTRYTVAIKDLPSAWEGRTIVQISDIHLGPVYRQHFFRRLVGKIKELNPEAVFITGDLFDGMEADFSWFGHDLDRLAAPKGIYYSFGNHDLYLGFNRVMELLSGKPITVLDNKMVTVDGLQIIGINYAFNNNFALDQAILRQVNYDPKQPSLLMFHDPNDIPLAKDAGVDLQLSGHTHNGQLFPLNLIVKAYYSGYNYGFFRDGDFNLIISSGAGSWGPPMKTSSYSEIVAIKLVRK